jgi:uncharacterized membrane protein YeaQ/YmgE (transglycosylase-associated protein family)
MAEFELTQAGQQWFQTILLWIGFGASAGILAKMLMPSREPSGAALVVGIGVLGSVIGPLSLSYFLPTKVTNPISPLGLAASAAVALVLMILYRLILCPLLKPKRPTTPQP